MTLEFKRRVRDLDSIWSEYLELLATCEISLLEKKVFFCKLRNEGNIFYRRVSYKKMFLFLFRRMNLKINCCKKRFS